MVFTKTTQSEDHAVVSRQELEEIEAGRRRLDEPTLRQAAAKLSQTEAQKFNEAARR